MMQVTEKLCQSILTRSSGYLKQVCSHSLNPYTGCGYGRSSCGVGCYVQSNPWLTRGRTWGSFVDVKTNADSVYLKTCERERRWAHKRSRNFSIFLSSSTEPWQPLEKRFRVTRRLLQSMVSQPPDELILQTHSTGLRDDLSLIGQLNRKCNLRVHISIEGDRDRLPGLPPPPATVEDRLNLLQELSQTRIKTVICLSPLTPLQKPDDFFRQLAERGAAAVILDHFIEGDGTLDGNRTLKTALPQAMEKVNPDSVILDYRERMAARARNYLPVGISAEGFAGRFLPPQ
jgi:DNA repair photolyase